MANGFGIQFCRQGSVQWLIVPAVLFAVFVAGCGSATEGSASQGEVILAADTAPPLVDLSQQPVADDPDPSVRAGAAANYLDCVHGISQGLGSIDFGPPPGSSDPDAALTVFVADELFVLPHRGYTAAGHDEHRLLYTHSVAGSPKVSIVVVDSANIELELDAGGEGWTVESFATCDPAEYDPSMDDRFPFEIWLDRDGNRVPTSVVSSAPGPKHCDQNTVTFLTVDGRGYVSDPDGALGEGGFTTPFTDDTELPDDAIETGYQRESQQLWLSAARDIAYIVDEDHVEAWPSPITSFECA